MRPNIWHDHCVNHLAQLSVQTAHHSFPPCKFKSRCLPSFFVNHPSVPCTMATDEKIVLQAAVFGRERHSLTHLWDGLYLASAWHHWHMDPTKPTYYCGVFELHEKGKKKPHEKKKKNFFFPWNYLYSSSILKHDFKSLMTSQFPPTVTVGAAVGRKRWSKQSHVKRPSLAIRYLMFFLPLSQNQEPTQTSKTRKSQRINTSLLE